jgi:small GTP-binding protein
MSFDKINYCSQLDEYNTFKIIVLGDMGCGKSLLIKMYKDNDEIHPFTDIIKLEPTIGVDLFIKRIVINDYKLKIKIWDTSGQDRFKIIRMTYYKNIHVAIIMCDLTNPNSLKRIKYWIDEYNNFRIYNSGYGNNNINTYFIIIGNILDINNTKISKTDIDNLLYNYNIEYKYFITNTTNIISINNVFNYIIYILIIKYLDTGYIPNNNRNTSICKYISKYCCIC